MTAIVVMGVCGTGKTTVGERLAQALGCPFLEGDSFHPASNVEKMRRGAPLDDADRWPWLQSLGRAIGEHVGRSEQVVTACSALKRVYRDRLREAASADITFILLDGDPKMLSERLEARQDHYMPPSLLDSQLAILERPGPDETAIHLDVREPPDALIEAALAALTQP